MGLCICLFDITKLEDAYVFPGDGASHTKGKYPLLLGVGFLGAVFSRGRGSWSGGWETWGLVLTLPGTSWVILGGIFPSLGLGFPPVRKGT